jgi:GTP-binding protein YchF
MQTIGILGLPRSGKTTLFEVLLEGAGAHAGHAGRESLCVVRVPDERLDRLGAVVQPKKTTHAQIEFIDSGAARGGRDVASARAAAKSDLFAGVRNCDAFLAVLRDFESAAEPAPGGVDPVRDLHSLETEFILNDLVIVEHRLERLGRELKVGKKEAQHEHALLERIKAHLESERSLRAEGFDAEEAKLVRGYQFLSQKPLLVVYNQDDATPRVPASAGPGSLAVGLKAGLEREIVSLKPEERPTFRAELGVSEDGLTVIIRACYELLGLISFFTMNPEEVKAWPLRRGRTALDAAGEVHTDMARGFIRAEVVRWDHMVEVEGHSGRAREKHWLRMEGRDYEVQDGECLLFRFSR